MLTLKSLKFGCIGRFIDPQEIYFDKLSQLNLVDAENKITGGSSGSGKTTIFLAHDWLLGMCDLPTNVLQSRLTKDHIWVEGEYNWDDKHLVIKRNRKLSITVDGIETVGSSKITEELLDSILGMPRNLFRQTLHRRQGDGGFFLQQTPAQMNAFLTDCLNLSTISSKIAVVDLKSKELYTAQSQAQSELQATQAALDATKSAQASLGEEPTTNVTEAILEGWKGQLDASQDTLKALQAQHVTEKAALDQKRPKMVTIPFDNSTFNALEVTAKELSDSINAVHAAERDRQAKVKEKISALRLEVANQSSAMRLDHGNKIAEIDNAINSINAAEKDRQARVNSQISALKLEIANNVSTLKFAHGKNVSEINSKISDLNRLVQAGEDAKKSAIKIAGQLKELRSGICFTCQQQWVTDSVKAQDELLSKELDKHKNTIGDSIKASNELVALKEQLGSFEDTYNQTLTSLTNQSKDQLAILTEQAVPQNPVELVALKEQLKVLNETLEAQLGAIALASKDKLNALSEEAEPQVPAEAESLNAKLSEIIRQKSEERQKEDAHNAAQTAANNKLMEGFFAEQGELSKKHKTELDVVTKEVEQTRSQYEQCRMTLKAHTEALVRHKTSLKSLKDKENEIDSKLVDINQKVVDTTQDLEIAEEVKRCLKSYLSCSFDDALESISQTATKILRAVPTMANATVRLVGQKETGSGMIKDQVTALLDNDGEIEINIKSLSGGERSALDLAIDLAVAELIQEVANKGINVMILDEPFGGFDSIGVEQALEMLKTLDKQILIVDHNPIAKEFIQDRITVVRDGETSYLK